MTQQAKIPRSDIDGSTQPVTSRMSARRIGFICGLLATIGPVSLTIYLPSLAEVTHYLGTPHADAQLSISLFFAGFALTQLICGPLSDGFGRKPVLIAFLLIYLSGSLLALFADSIGVLIAARVLQGAGSAVGIALSRAIVRDLFTLDRAVKIQAGVGIAMALGPVVAPTIGGAIVHFGNWHLVFLAMLGLGVIALAVVTLLYRETLVDQQRPIRPGQIVIAYGQIVRTPHFLLPALVLGGTNGTFYAQATVLPLVMIEQLGLTPYQFGIFMLAQSLSFIAASIVVRRLVGQVPVRRITLFGLILVGLVCIAMPMILINFQPSAWLLAIPISLFGAAVACTMPTMTVAALDSFPTNHGAASAVLGFIQMGSGLVGGFVASLFVDPSVALAFITFAMGTMAIVSGLGWRQLAPAAVTQAA